jgi:hypothetical protein
MRPAPPQRELFVRPAPSSDTVVVNDRVCFQTEEKQRVVFVHGVIFSHYAIEDRTAEAYAMVLLFESGYADQPLVFPRTSVNNGVIFDKNAMDSGTRRVVI